MSQVEVNPSSIEAFADATCLVPAIVLDGVVDEVCSFLHYQSKYVDGMFETLRGAEVESAISEKTLYAYHRSPAFKRKMHAADPRPAYYSFMRHWVATELKARFPEQYRVLPSSFANGAPLPRG